MSSTEAVTDAKSRLKGRLTEIGIPAGFSDEIIGHHTLVNYNKGAMIFLQGSPADFLFCVFTGLAKVYCPRSDGSRILMKLAGPGDLIGYVDYIDPKGRRSQAFEVEAFTKCSVALCTRERVIELLRSLDQGALSQMVEQLNTAWSSMAQWFGTFLGMSFRERLEIVLKELGAKFGVSDTRGTLLMPELSHSDLADMIGSSRPMVSRLIAEMTEEGFLLRQGRQFILLEPLAEEKFDSPRQRIESNGVRSTVGSSPLPNVSRPLLKQPAPRGDSKLRIGPLVSSVALGGSARGVRTDYRR